MTPHHLTAMPRDLALLKGCLLLNAKPLGVLGVLAIRGAKEILVMFFCYCAVESTAGLWASSYMVMHSGIDKITAASWASYST